MPNLLDGMIMYESGKLSKKQVLNLFACLIRSGTVWSIGGSYSKTAAALIKEGYISREGKILIDNGFLSAAENAIEENKKRRN